MQETLRINSGQAYATASIKSPEVSEIKANTISVNKDNIRQDSGIYDFKIGRNELICAFSTNSRAISRQHLNVTVNINDRAVTIKDLGSSNCTKIEVSSSTLHSIGAADDSFIDSRTRYGDEQWFTIAPSSSGGEFSLPLDDKWLAELAPNHDGSKTLESLGNGILILRDSLDEDQILASITFGNKSEAISTEIAKYASLPRLMASLKNEVFDKF